MRKSTIAVIVIVVILIGGGIAALSNKSSDTITNNSNTNTTPTPSNTNNNSTASTQPSATGTVEIKNMAFTPPQITIAKGGTVTWTNNDTTAHTITDDLTNVGGPASGDIAPGGTYNYTFDKVGSYQYHCSIHPSMRGTIVVK